MINDRNYHDFVVAELYGGGYDWSGTWLLKNPENGQFYIHNDSGCSCYGPFESVNSWEDLVHVRGVEDAQREARLNTYDFTAAERAEFRRKLYDVFSDAK